MILLGVIHKVRTLRGGKGGPPKSVLACIGARGSFSCKRMYAIVVFLQFQMSYSDDQNCPFPSPRYSQRYKFDAEVLLGVLNRHFPIASCSSFLIR